jgi:2'-5' RNA ligase
MIAADRPRLFVAIELPDTVRQALRDATAPWRASLTDFRWSAADALHLTVVFIGHVGAGDVGTIASAIGAVAQQHPPVPTGLTRSGAFPGRGTQNLWLGLDDPPTPWGGWPAASRPRSPGSSTIRRSPYHPHITIARPAPSAVPPGLFDAQVPAYGGRSTR